MVPPIIKGVALMKEQTVDLHQLLEVEAVEEVRTEVILIHRLAFPASSTLLFERCFDDTVRLFSGSYAGYQACKTEYHDLRHTLEVVLATVRMTHAAVLSGRELQPHVAELALVSAMMHDTGYIQPIGESGTGGQYTLEHVERSAEFFLQYSQQLGLSELDQERCCCMITATSLSVDPDEIIFPDPGTELAAKLVASADLIGQLSDRIYLEKLLFLYQEFREAGIMAYANELDLLSKTCAFYKMVQQRLEEKLDGLDQLLHLHFKSRWNIDSDLYRDSITLNFTYLEKLLQDSKENYRSKLKRGGIVARIMKAEEAANGVQQFGAL